ncbi:MFS transporter [Streptomyces sp900116325]|uniref:MFS transporter n=1 Tax=Streptomyces sp. 900116325 TaxID=3154295 RepID=UPI0033A6BBD5
MSPTPDPPTPATAGPAASMGHLPGTAGYRLIMISMFAAGMATFVLMYATQALLPEFATSFSISPTKATLSITLTTAALAVTLLVVGPVSEYVGRTPLIRISAWAAALVGLACALAPGWGSLIALRALEGAALAGLPAVATAYLREEVHPSAGGRAAGLYIGGTAIGGMAGRLLTAPIADAYGWRAALAAAAVLALLCAALVTVLLPRSAHFAPSTASWRTIPTTARQALADPALLSLYGLAMCAIGTLVAVFNALAFRLTWPPFSLSVGALSLVYVTYMFGTVSSALAGRAADRLGRRAVLPLGCVLALAGVALMSVDALVFVVGGLSVLVIGFFIIHGLASGWVTARARAADISTGQAASFYLVSFYIGSSMFGNLGSTAWSHAGWPGVLALAGSLLTVASMLAWRLRRIPALTP